MYFNYWTQAIFKLSSKDSILIPLILKDLIKINTEFEDQIFFIEKIESKKYDAIMLQEVTVQQNILIIILKTKRKLLEKIDLQ